MYSIVIIININYYYDNIQVCILPNKCTTASCYVQIVTQGALESTRELLITMANINSVHLWKQIGVRKDR